VIDDPVPTDDEIYEPKDAEPWLSAIKHSEKQFDRWRHLADRIDRIYSSLERFNSLTGGGDGNLALDREFDIFWASVEVIKPSVYSRAPVPVVTPRFKDRTPVKRITAELLERSAISAFELTDIDQVMLGVRDDLVIVGRGQPWVSYEDDGDEWVCVEHLDRLDFLHDPARKWSEVTWVARRAWLTRKEMRERFSGRSGDLYLDANYSTRRDKDNTVYGADDHVEKAGVWELWDRSKEKVVWVTEGCAKTLDEDKPHLKLKNYFPCPRPAYGTLQRRTLVPVPDLVRVQAQMESINLLTSRIHDLVGKLVVKGIIPAGTEVGDAVEAALREQDASYMLIPVPAMSITDGAKVEWLPIDQVAQAILAAVEARREIIGNVQELLGIADIQRGDSDPNETLGAQQLKVQNTSIRTRDRVNELVRVARDVVCIMAEIMADEFSVDTLLKMAQMELPTNAMVKKELKDIEAKAKSQLEELEAKAEEAMANPEGGDPSAAAGQLQQAQQQILAQANEQIAKVGQSVTVEQVRELLKDTKTDPFMFDIETDSTIYPDEMAEKAARNEFMATFVTASQALAPLAMSGPAGAKMAGGLIKFQLGPYRAGRELEGLIDEWTESLENMPQQPNPEAEKAKAQAETEKGKLAMEGQRLQMDGQFRERELGLKEQELQLKAQEIQSKPQTEMQKEQLKAQAHMQERTQDAEVAVMREQAQLEADTQTTQMTLEADAAREAQKQMAEAEQFAVDDQFRREELAIETALEYEKIDQQAEQARQAAITAAMKPKGTNNA
jgi:hypothetical protein